MTRTIGELQGELWNSPEWKTLTGYRQLGLSLRLFFNADERLNEVVDVATGDWLDFDWWEPGNAPLRAQIVEEIVRRLHQYGASAITLLDHVQTFAATLGRDHEGLIHAEVRRRFLDDPLSSFVRDLRNYSTHEQ